MSSDSAPTAFAQAVDTAVAFVDRPGRARWRVTGPDRSKFFQNLTTNDVDRLRPGNGCECFVTSPQGKTLGFVTLLMLDDAILMRTEADCLPVVQPHLDKYGALDEIERGDITETTFEYHLAGSKAADLISALGASLPPEGDLNHTESSIAGKPVRLVREAPLGRPGVSLTGESEDADTIKTAITDAGQPLGLVELSAVAFDALRIEAGTPASGRDVTEKNLPQEIGRDDRAINFVKGCYLGQEPVARIDALGHVNRHLRGLTFDADSPPTAGSKLFTGEKQKEIGWITSSAVSQRTGRPIALGFVRSAQSKPGTNITVRTDDGTETSATVAELPMMPIEA